MGKEGEKWVCFLEDTKKEACSLAEAVKLERLAGGNRREQSSGRGGCLMHVQVSRAEGTMGED